MKFRTLDADRAYLENKYHFSDDPSFDSFKRMEHHGYEYDHGTGMSDEEIREGIAALVESLKGQPHPTIKSRAVAYVLDNTRIDVNEHDYFVGIWSWSRLIDPFTVKCWEKEIFARAREERGSDMLGLIDKTGTAWSWLDFDHTVPDWDSMARLGFKGILDRATASYHTLRESGRLTEKQAVFYDAIRTEYEALLRLLDRLYRYASTRTFEKAPRIAESLRNLRDGAPKTAYDMMQMIYIYFMVSESVDHYQVRSLGYGLDSTLLPFYLHDLESGATTREQFAEDLAYFLMQFSAIGNYWGQPFYMAGTNADGSSRVSEVSHIILDVYDQLGIYNPKIQIKVNLDTPKDFVCKALEMIRSGSTSIVFLNEEIIVRALMKRGAAYEEAVDSVISGCYEYNCRAQGIAISSVYFNLPKCVSLVFTNGIDALTGQRVGAETGDVTRFTSFAQFHNAFFTQFRYIVDTVFDELSVNEKYVHECNPSALFSATLPSCAETLTDALDSGTDNVTGTLLNGFATAVDSLMAVYELVFEKKYTTLAEMKAALEADWVGYEKLRLRALNAKHKYGNGDRIADLYANAIHQFYSGLLSGRLNCHGGRCTYELHSARSFIEQGKKTAATPDGRRAGEELSKNASPVNGADRSGITTLISSATQMDLSLADSGACLDAMLHPSAVQGDDGLEVLYGVLNTYLKKGGASIHFNIFNAEVLRDAQKNPDKYRNLQVRVCGWNVLWNNMEKSEQDAYILRAETIQ